MLTELYRRGPVTVGIFRKSANARVCREFRAKLESSPGCAMADVPVLVIASVFKVRPREPRKRLCSRFDDGELLLARSPARVNKRITPDRRFIGA